MLYPQNTGVQAPPGSSLYLLGQSTDGPVNEPVHIEGPAEAKRIFGEGNLLEAYRQTIGVPDVTVFLMRISGDYARLSLVGEVEGQRRPILSLRAAKGGSKYNSLTARVEDEFLIIGSPETPGAESVYDLQAFDSLKSLVHQINLDSRTNRGVVVAEFSDLLHEDIREPEEDEDPRVLRTRQIKMSEAYNRLQFQNPSILVEHNQTPHSFRGGEDGVDLTKDELFIALDTSYSILEGRPIDVICPFPARFDDIHPAVRYGDGVYGEFTYAEGDYLGLVDDETGLPVTFHGQLTDFCRTQEGFGFFTHGVMGLRENEERDQMAPHFISRLAGATAFTDRYDLTEYSYGQYIDKGHHLSVYAQDNLSEDGSISGAAMYAAMIAGLPIDATTTNRPVPPGVELAFELDPEEIRALSEIGVVAARGSVRKGIVITNGVTAGLPSSPLRLIGNVRMIQFTLHTLNQALDGMVGEPYLPGVTIREMEERTRNALQHLVDRGVLTEYRHDISINATDMTAEIALELRPKFSVEFVKAGTSMRFNMHGGE